MDTLEFKRCDGSGGNVSRRLINDQQLVDKQFTKCVMCGTNKPYWKLAKRMTLRGTTTLFRCDKCGGIFSVSDADLSDEHKSTSAVDFGAMFKEASGMDVNKKYIKFEKYGSDRSAESIVNEGGSLTHEDYRALSALDFLRPSSDRENGNTGGRPASTANNTPARFSSIEEIKQYKELMDQGIITQEEFEKKKKQIMGK